MSIKERATVFSCDDEQLVGIVSCPSRPVSRGVLIVVGGPQYRVGSHRQFTLLCRALANNEVAAMRFDYRGMGDSEGDMRNFEAIQSDIRVAVDRFCVEVPELREVVIWGLCDAASAALMYAHCDARVAGLVLLNPWVRTLEGLAKVQIKHYYRSRFTDREFWRKVVKGNFNFVAATRSFGKALVTALGAGKARSAAGDPLLVNAGGAGSAVSLQERMAEGLSQFRGRVLLILSGNDLTAREFEEVVRGSSKWRQLIAEPRVESVKLTGANHTFSSEKWRDEVATCTLRWARSW